ncbi:MAG TPA: CapA family protein [Anaerolineaceae bacterium]
MKNTAKRFKGGCLALCFCLLATGCNYPVSAGLAPTRIPEPTQFSAAPTDQNLPDSPSPSPTSEVTPSPTPLPDFTIWLNPTDPAGLISQVTLPDGLHSANQANDALFSLDFGNSPGLKKETIKNIDWIYALVAPFPSLVDGVTSDELAQAWKGKAQAVFKDKPLLVDQNTEAVFEAIWGPPGANAVRILPAGRLLDEAWNSRPSWGLQPFESLEPKWKVLTVDGQSPLHKDFDPSLYSLAVHMALTGESQAAELLKEVKAVDLAGLIPSTNRDPKKMTILLMTGVTGLVRATAARMEKNGVNYPGQDIVDWLRSGDFTHISNEVSFSSDCPYPNASSTSLLFCSRDAYIGLLDFVGANIIELTGNHSLDWGKAAAQATLDLYHQRGWFTFGGGGNLEEAQKPLLVDHNGNHLALIGCNLVGPVGAWATDTQPGAAPCGDYQWMLSQILTLRSAGFLPVVTFQYSENYTDTPGYQEKVDYRKMVDAGAIIVNGSQAHTPKSMEFYDDGFIHYGLGNLFFDQMHVQVGENLISTTRDEFIDRHIFYNGRYISSELLTARLEDFARPRPMTPAERATFLTTIFTASGWYNGP